MNIQRPLRVLIADDTEANLTLAKAVIERMGHHALLARNGEQAVRLFGEAAPDLALIDILMPRIDGIEAVRRMRALPALRWVPVIFTTALDETDDIVRGLEAGGDDYLTKPLNTRILQSKIRAAERVISLQERTAQNAVELAEYYANAEEEKRFARRIMDRLASTSRLSDPAVRAWVAPAAHLSGDVVAGARTPDGRLHVLLADGTGHGLAAALNALPIVQPFYAMTAKGFSPATLLGELNHKLNTLLPTECFAAVGLVRVSPGERRIEVWNGGLPDILLLNGRGELLRSFPSTELPLGVLSRERFDAKLESVGYDDACQLILCSDGLMEAENALGERFGLQCVHELAASVPPERRYERLVRCIKEHLQDRAALDDISFVMVDCLLGQQELALPAAVPDTRPSSPGRWRAALSLDAIELRSVDIVPVLLGLARTFPATEASSAPLFVVLSELVTNAIDHGLLALETATKDEPEGFDRYLALRGERLVRLEEGEISVSIEYVGGEIEVVVADTGPGFDVEAVLGRTASQGRGGRGLALVSGLCSHLEFRGSGNVAVARLHTT